MRSLSSYHYMVGVQWKCSKAYLITVKQYQLTRRLITALQVSLETANFHVTPNHTKCTKNYGWNWALICPNVVELYIKAKFASIGVCEKLMLNGRLWNQSVKLIFTVPTVSEIPWTKKKSLFSFGGVLERANLNSSQILLVRWFVVA